MGETALNKLLNLTNIFFLLQIYPDATHSLQSVRPHLYLSMESFLDSCFMEVAKDEDMETVIGL